MLNEVDADLATATKVGNDTSDNEEIRYVQVTGAWTKFREDLTIRMYSDYQTRLVY